MNKLNLSDFYKMKQEGLPITWITAYDYPFAMCAELAGIDMILVGDSGGMVQLGYNSTNPVTMDEMITLSQAVKRGAQNTFIVGDMPQGSYEVSTEDAVRNAMRFSKESGCDAVKLEGGKRVADKVKAIVDAGIVVVGHLGLTPQSSTSFGGYRVQGKSVESFESTLKDALALQEAGVSLLLLEAMPIEVAEKITQQLDIPVMGIGVGNKVDGQLIIMHDLVGFYQPFRPHFAKCYIPEVIEQYTESLKSKENLKEFGKKERKDGLLPIVELAIKHYCSEVKSREFPNDDYSYKISEDDLNKLKKSNYWI